MANRKTVIFAATEDIKSILNEIYSSFSNLTITHTEAETIQACNELGLPLDLLIFVNQDTSDSILELLETLRVFYPKVSVVVFAETQISVDIELAYHEKGVNDVVRVPFVHGIIEAKISKIILLRNEISKLSDLATNDGLTNVFNRGHFDKSLCIECDRAIRQQDFLSLMIVDIDYFKKYNDTYGHPKGDEAIKSVSAVLKNCARRPTDIVSRYGGEEFAILLPGTNREGAKVVAGNIQKTLLSLGIEHSASTASGFLTVSIGLVTAKFSQATIFSPTVATALVEQADRCLYEAKHNGRNLVVQKEYFYSK